MSKSGVPIVSQASQAVDSIGNAIGSIFSKPDIPGSNNTPPPVPTQNDDSVIQKEQQAAAAQAARKGRASTFLTGSQDPLSTGQTVSASRTLLGN